MSSSFTKQVVFKTKQILEVAETQPRATFPSLLFSQLQRFDLLNLHMLWYDYIHYCYSSLRVCHLLLCADGSNWSPLTMCLFSRMSLHPFIPQFLKQVMRTIFSSNSLSLNRMTIMRRTQIWLIFLFNSNIGDDDLFFLFANSNQGCFFESSQLSIGLRTRKLRMRNPGQ